MDTSLLPNLAFNEYRIIASKNLRKITDEISLTFFEKFCAVHEDTLNAFCLNLGNLALNTSVDFGLLTYETYGRLYACMRQEMSTEARYVWHAEIMALGLTVSYVLNISPNGSKVLVLILDYFPENLFSSTFVLDSYRHHRPLSELNLNILQ